MFNIGGIFKWTAILGIVTALSTGGYFIFSEIQEKGKLEAELNLANQTNQLLNIAIAEKARAEVALYEQVRKLESEAETIKKRFNLTAIEELAKTQPERVANLFYTNTDIMFTEFEQKLADFSNRHTKQTEVPPAK